MESQACSHEGCNGRQAYKKPNFERDNFGVGSLWASNIFAQKNIEFLKRLVEEFRPESFLPGDVIIDPSDNGENMYFLHLGQVEVTIGSESEQSVILCDGSVFGEMGLFSDQRCNAMVRAIAASDCRVIRYSVFSRILRGFDNERAFFERLALQRRGKLDAIMTLPRMNPLRLATPRTTWPRRSDPAAMCGHRKSAPDFTTNADLLHEDAYPQDTPPVNIEPGAKVQRVRPQCRRKGVAQERIRSQPNNKCPSQGNTRDHDCLSTASPDVLAGQVGGTERACLPDTPPVNFEPGTKMQRVRPHCRRKSAVQEIEASLPNNPSPTLEITEMHGFLSIAAPDVVPVSQGSKLHAGQAGGTRCHSHRQMHAQRRRVQNLTDNLAATAGVSPVVHANATPLNTGFTPAPPPLRRPSSHHSRRRHHGPQRRERQIRSASVSGVRGLIP